MQRLRFSWYHPLESPELNFRPGRKKRVLDIFGAWIPADDISFEDSEVLPTAVQPANKVLVFDFDPEEDETQAGSLRIPFEVLDQVMDHHGIDVTGLSFSSTKRGNLYRTHRLMIPIS